MGDIFIHFMIHCNFENGVALLCTILQYLRTFAIPSFDDLCALSIQPTMQLTAI